MNTQEKIEVMKAYAEGKKIEWKIRGCHGWNEWTANNEPTWNWLMDDFRIKTEPTCRPYKDTEEMIEDYCKRFPESKPSEHSMPFIWIKDREEVSFASLITEFGYSCVWRSVIQEGVPLKKLFNDYVYLDGSPCGKLEASK